MNRTSPKRKKNYRAHANAGNLCWRLTQKYDRYKRTNAKIGACQEVGAPDPYCPVFGALSFRVGHLGRNRACTACGRYWIA